MRSILTILAFLIFYCAKSQPIKENFIKDVYHNFVDSAVSKFNLSDVGDPFPLLLASSFRLNEQLSKVIPDSTFQSLITNCKTDTAKYFWDETFFTNATLINTLQIDTLLGRLILSKYSTESNKQYEKRKKELERKRGSVYFFSNPIFDKTQKYALICVAHACGTGCGEGCVYLFHLSNQDWQLILKFSCWIS